MSQGTSTIYRPCPECGSPVESHTVKAKCIQTYICSVCAAQLWLIQTPLFDKLIVAQVGSKRTLIH